MAAATLFARALICGAMLTVTSAPPTAGQVSHRLTDKAARVEAPGDARFMRRTLARLPREAQSDAKVVVRQAPPPQIVDGADGGAEPQVPPAAPESPIAPAPKVRRAAEPVARNYGRGNEGTIYHYTDLRVDRMVVANRPFRQTGVFQFVAASGVRFRCSAALIARSILATAGHCVHDGGNEAEGWIRSGRFYPAYNAGENRLYGSAAAAHLHTTTGWYQVGALDEGYDVGLVVLEKPSGRKDEVGAATGVYGFCYEDCLQEYWHFMQLGFPGNYFEGRYMTQSQHLARSDGRDFFFGTGMEGGSSGGPHLSNPGYLINSSTAGQRPTRNTLFAVMSWGYIDPGYKLGGASSLSGPNNTNGFKAMFNKACGQARALHDSASCTPLP